jgi:hypothetical protein
MRIWSTNRVRPTRGPSSSVTRIIIYRSPIHVFIIVTFFALLVLLPSLSLSLSRPIFGYFLIVSPCGTRKRVHVDSEALGNLFKRDPLQIMKLGFDPVRNTRGLLFPAATNKFTRHHYVVLRLKLTVETTAVRLWTVYDNDKKKKNLDIIRRMSFVMQTTVVLLSIPLIIVNRQF